MEQAQVQCGSKRVGIVGGAKMVTFYSVRCD